MQAPYPLSYKRISSKFGWRWLQFNGGKAIPDFHKGWDFAAKEDTEVFANVSGIAHVRYEPNGFGYYVRIEGKTKQQNLFKVYFGHLKKNIIVKDNEEVKIGTFLGYVGTSGRSTGFHLHWECRVLTKGYFVAIDPKFILSGELHEFIKP